MNLRLSRAHWPVTVLGPGRRIGVWFQGCTIGCPDCMARDTWSEQGGTPVPVEALLGWCREISAGRPDGVTITGGEPFEQPAALLALLDGFADWRSQDRLDFDLLCYSGRPLAALRDGHPGILARLDALIPEPFVHRRPRGALWRGSDNQPLLPLSLRGERRYAQYREVRPEGRGEVQIAVTGREIWYIGIPERGDMARIRRAAGKAGLSQEDPSWRL